MNKSESFNKNHRKHLLSVHNEQKEEAYTAAESPTYNAYSNDTVINQIVCTSKQKEMILDGKTVSKCIIC